MVELGVVASGFLHLLASQVSTRLVTFSLNLLIARHLTPEAYGLLAVQFHLLTTTIMMLSREGLRRGCMRLRGEGGQSEVSPWRVLSVAWLVLPLGAISSAGVCAVFLALHARAGKGGSTYGVPGYERAVVLHGVAAMIELLAEPFYMLASVNMRFGVRVVMDSAPLAAKSLVQLAALGGYAGPVAQAAPPALIFAAAQLALAVVTLVGYAVFGVSELRRWRCGGAAAGAAGPPAAVAAGAGVAAAGAPAAVAATSRNGPKPKAGESASVDDEKEEVAAGEEGAEAGLRQRRGAAAGGTAAGNQSKAASGDSKDTRGSTQQGQEAKRVLGMWGPDEREAISTSAIFSLQAVEKLVLAEGSKAVLAGAASAYDAGVVGLVNNLGSLVVRTLFQPLEEVSFAAFSRHAVSSANDPSSTSQLASVLGFMVRAVALLGLAAVAYGPAYTYLAVRLVYGERWAATEAPAVLGVYCAYILLLALNGVTEAFVHAVMDKASLAASNVALIGFTAVHVAACVALIARMGSVGLVAADALNMALRIVLSAWFIGRHFRGVKGFMLTSLLPNLSTCAVFGAAAAAVQASQAVLLQPASFPPGTRTAAFLKPAALHVAVGVAVLCATAVAVMRTEAETLRALKALWRARRGGGAADAVEGGAGKGEVGAQDGRQKVGSATGAAGSMKHD